MNKKEIFKIAIIAIAGTGVAAMVVNALLGDINEKSVKFNDIEVINSAVGMPDPEIFNDDAINPTVDVYVGNCLDANGDNFLDRDELTNCYKGE